MESAPYSCPILMKLEFSGQIFEKKNSQVANFKQIHPVVAELFCANGHEEANSRFHSFADVPKIWFLHSRRGHAVVQ
jgi:hypothetical protein